jgi:hypothetical protein
MIDKSHTMKKMKSLHLIIAALFFFLFISSFIIFSNLHFHVFDGFLIVHGHPYGKTQNNNFPLDSNTHSSFEYLYYSSTANFEALFFLFVSIIFFVKLLNFIQHQIEQFIYINPFFSIPCFRAPPHTF